MVCGRNLINPWNQAIHSGVVSVPQTWASPLPPLTQIDTEGYRPQTHEIRPGEERALRDSQDRSGRDQDVIEISHADFLLAGPTCASFAGTYTGSLGTGFCFCCCWYLRIAYPARRCKHAQDETARCECVLPRSGTAGAPRSELQPSPEEEGLETGRDDPGSAAGKRAYQPMWWPPLMSRLEPVIQAASSLARKATA